MQSRKKPKTWLQRFFASKLILGGTLILLVLISVGLSKAVYKRYQIQKEIAAIRKEIEKAEGKNRELMQFIEYLKTSAFQEKMARQKLNLKREGENVIIVPSKKEDEETIIVKKDKNEEETPDLSLHSRLENPKKWWHFFFSNY